MRSHQDHHLARCLHGIRCELLAYSPNVWYTNLPNTCALPLQDAPRGVHAVFVNLGAILACLERDAFELFRSPHGTSRVCQNVYEAIRIWKGLQP